MARQASILFAGGHQRIDTCIELSFIACTFNQYGQRELLCVRWTQATVIFHSCRCYCVWKWTNFTICCLLPLVHDAHLPIWPNNIQCYLKLQINEWFNRVVVVEYHLLRISLVHNTLTCACIMCVQTNCTTIISTVSKSYIYTLHRYKAIKLIAIHHTVVDPMLNRYWGRTCQ